MRPVKARENFQAVGFTHCIAINHPMDLTVNEVIKFSRENQACIKIQNEENYLIIFGWPGAIQQLFTKEDLEEALKNEQKAS